METSDYERQKNNNEKVFKEGLRIMRPDIFVLMDNLDTSGVDPWILSHVIYALEQIAHGTKYGEVRLFVENGVVTFVRGEESKKLNLAVIKAP